MHPIPATPITASSRRPTISERRATLKLKLQLFSGDEIALGPGKVTLIEAIAATGSISAAARATGMSYRRAWLLVDTLNRCFADPIVEAHPGDGARLTAAGEQLAAAYRRLAERCRPADDDPDLAAIERALRPAPVPRR